MHWLGRDSGVRSFGLDTIGYRALAQHFAGYQTIPVAAIVGSVGRSHELASDFLPLRRRKGDDRYGRVLQAVQQGAGLPPIDVYKLGGRYYVLDGHHRVAAARKTGQKEIDASVIEFQPVSRQAGAAA